MSRPFVRTIREFERLASTSDTARQIVLGGGIELPLLVLTHEQTAGRGRGDNRWWSGEGSLTFTIGIDPRAYALRPEHEPRVALAFAVAICRAIEDDAWSPAIRWPNDVECEGRKLAGILPERVETAEGPRLLIGTGLNLFNRFEDAPDSIRAMATSIALEWPWSKAVTAGVSGTLDQILSEMPILLRQLADDDGRLADEWRTRDSLHGRYVRLKTDEAIITGIGAGIAPDGGLRIRSIGEEAKVYYGGQVLRDM
jgi:BirA family transcriptional regulator, biotin operon repressor / biotin---[acetyl-CoA-carboxylase] ligase